MKRKYEMNINIDMKSKHELIYVGYDMGAGMIGYAGIWIIKGHSATSAWNLDVSPMNNIKHGLICVARIESKHGLNIIESM